MVATGAGDGAVAGEGGIVEEGLAEGDAFGEEGVVARERGHGKAPAHFEGEGGVVFREVERGDGGEGDFGRWVADSEDGEAAGEVGDEGAGDGVAGVGAGGGAVFFEGEWAGVGEEIFEIEGEGDCGGGFDLKAGGELDLGEVVVVGEVVNEALEFVVGGAVAAFEGEEDVASGPVPVEIVEVGVERRVGGEFGGVGVVLIFGDAEGEAEAFVGAGRDVGEGEVGAAGFSIEPGELVGEGEPFAVGLLDGEVAEEVAEAGDGESLGSFVLERAEGEGLSIELVGEVDAEVASGEPGKSEGDEDDEAHGRRGIRSLDFSPGGLGWGRGIGLKSKLRSY